MAFHVSYHQALSAMIQTTTNLPKWVSRDDDVLAQATKLCFDRVPSVRQVAAVVMVVVAVVAVTVLTLLNSN